MKVRLGQRGWVIAASAVALIATAGIASGSIPGVGGVVSACYAKTTVGNNNTVGPPGSIHPIDKEAGKACTTKESALDLYTKQGADAAFLGKTAKAADADRLDGRDSTEFVGPAGPQGAAGPAGAPGQSGLPKAYLVRVRTGPTVPEQTEVGAYTLIIKSTLPPGIYRLSGVVHLQNRSATQAFTVRCGLVPSNSDGTGEAQGQADWGELNLAPSGAGDRGEVTAMTFAALSHQGYVELRCNGSGNTLGASTSYAAIHAMEVSDIVIGFGQ